MRNRPDYLFSKTDWFSVSEHQKKGMMSEISQLEKNRILKTPIADLCDYFEKKYKFEIPILLADQIIADQKEAKIDVSQDQMRYIRDRTQPFYIDGTQIEITLPFEGDDEAFVIKPTTYNLSPPSAEIRGDRLIIKITGSNLEPEVVRNQIDKSISDINGYLTNLRKDALPFNDGLRHLAEEAINVRKKKLLSDQDLVSSLGFPFKEKE